MSPTLTAVYIAVMVIASLVLLCYCVFLILALPGKKRKGAMNYATLRYAHRGLHGNGVPENSLTAFDLAAKEGFAIELDVRLSADGEIVIFHDDTLTRVAGVDKRVDELTLAQLKELRLLDTDERIPTFSEVLSLVDGRVPILVEIKEDGSDHTLAEKTCAVLREYKGEYVLESFNPLTLGCVRKIMPEAYRGMLSRKFYKHGQKGFKFLLLERLLLNFKARPDFIAYDVDDINSSYALGLVLGLSRIPLVVWTVKSEEEEKKAIESGAVGIIFEGYLPSDGARVTFPEKNK